VGHANLSTARHVNDDNLPLTLTYRVYPQASMAAGNDPEPSQSLSCCMCTQRARLRREKIHRCCLGQEFVGKRLVAELSYIHVFRLPGIATAHRRCLIPTIWLCCGVSKKHNHTWSWPQSRQVCCLICYRSVESKHIARSKKAISSGCRTSPVLPESTPGGISSLPKLVIDLCPIKMFKKTKPSLKIYIVKWKVVSKGEFLKARRQRLAYDHFPYVISSRR
jgi:hypothetical protein